MLLIIQKTQLETLIFSCSFMLPISGIADVLTMLSQYLTRKSGDSRQRHVTFFFGERKRQMDPNSTQLKAKHDFDTIWCPSQPLSTRPGVAGKRVGLLTLLLEWTKLVLSLNFYLSTPQIYQEKTKPLQKKQNWLILKSIFKIIIDQ